MPTIDIIRGVKVSRSPRCQQLQSVFDVPPMEESVVQWHGKIPIEDESWNVGLIVGPSGSGKSTIGQEVFGEAYHPPLEWKGKSIIDDFPDEISINDIAAVCQAVGFNTIPAWMRPFKVLSTGEKFRVDLARRFLSLPDPIVVDEFTSVVDRQIAKIGAHAVQKYVRKNNRQFIGLSCHYDIIEWLRPDWVFEPATMEFTSGRWLQQGRPKLEIEIKRVPYSLWKRFAPFHYMSAELHKAAQCFGLFVGDEPVAFAGVLHYPNPRVKNIKKFSRVVTLPDWQGLGLIFILMEKVASAYKALGFRHRGYPAHPGFIRAMAGTKEWQLIRKPALFQKTKKGVESKINPSKVCRPYAVFEYVGPAMEDRTLARSFVYGKDRA